ncbi:cytidylyltransferase domain-containing protein [Marinobacterium sp. YM272]|uniref:acylneuraminate cytidylyltransferase family protein n=1 Tax=Marinobacterium sp. YM272 TaxID=3421654 RepID=UPI003D7F1F60
MRRQGDNSIVAVIPARSGSKGISGKNLTELGGKPLIVWTIEAAIASGCVDRVIVSTDCETIASVARAAGAEVPFLRPANLAADEVHAVHVVFHALDWFLREESLVPEAVMMLLPTSPLRRASDINGAVELFRNEQASSVISVVDLGKYLTNLRYLDGHQLSMVAPGEDRNAQRQGQSKLFSVNGAIFMARPAQLRKAGTFHMEDSVGFVMDYISSIDINEQKDLELARRLCGVLEPWNAIKSKVDAH